MSDPVTVIIPSWNGYSLLKKCLPALLAQPGNFQIIVVDNGSTDGTVTALTQDFPMVQTIALPENLGFSGAVNAGIKAAGTNDVILLNNDTQVQPGWLDALRQAASEFTSYHLYCSKVVLTRSPDQIDTVGDGFTIAGFGYKHCWLSPSNETPVTPFEVFGGSGCALMIRRETINRVGLFDDDFFAFGEDLDYSFRARLAGCRVLSIPDAVVYHDVRATAPGEKTLFWYHRNLIWLIIKNYPWQLLLLYAPHVMIHMLLVLLRSTLRGWANTYICSVFAALKGLPDMLRKRRLIQASREISLNNLRQQLDANWPAIHLMLHRAKKNAEKSVK